MSCNVITSTKEGLGFGSACPFIFVSTTHLSSAADFETLHY